MVKTPGVTKQRESSRAAGEALLFRSGKGGFVDNPGISLQPGTLRESHKMSHSRRSFIQCFTVLEGFPSGMETSTHPTLQPLENIPQFIQDCALLSFLGAEGIVWEVLIAFPSNLRITEVGKAP